MNAREIESLSKATAGLINELMAPLLKRVADLESRLASIPLPQKGEPGEKGVDGRDGADGEPGASVTVDDVMPALLAHLEKAIAAIPVPRNGTDGRDGKDGADGRGVAIEDFEKLLKSMQAEWALDFERRAQALLQGAIDRAPVPKDGKDGRDGIDGNDGLGFDDLSLAYDGRRTVTFTYARGEQRKDVPIRFPVVIDCGVWKEGDAYEAGDGATFGGSFWIAQKNTDDKPGTSESWRLAVKKGRDGKDA